MRRLHGLLVLLAGTTACELITGAGDLTIRERSDAAAGDASSDVAADGSAPSDAGRDDATSDASLDASDASDSGQPNQCLAAGCDPKASCSSADGGIQCQCPSGYTTSDLGHTCVDVDECLVPNRCGGGATCQNVAGGFTCTCPVGGCSVVFDAFGTYEFMVPSGVPDITVDVWGAGGGASVGNNVFGGAGGYTFGHLAAPAGTTLDVLVGQGGYAGVNGGNAPGSFGGGGGAGNYGGGGGGRSAVSAGATPYFVAGGGGGAGYHTGNTTGAGGGLVGGNTLVNCGGGGLGGQQGAGGGGGPGATAGVSGIGGTATQSMAGGGGGGYFGGGGGGNDCGGGGGSGYYRGSAPVSAATSTVGTAETPAGTARPTYGGNAGRGGAGVKFQATWNAGVDGRVVFTWQ